MEESLEMCKIAALPSVDTQKRASLALWLLSSDTTNPTYDDVMGWGRSQGAVTFEETEALLKKAIEKERLTKVLEEIEYPLIPVLEAMEHEG